MNRIFTKRWKQGRTFQLEGDLTLAVIITDTYCYSLHTLKISFNLHKNLQVICYSPIFADDEMGFEINDFLWVVLLVSGRVALKPNLTPEPYCLLGSYCLMENRFVKGSGLFGGSWMSWFAFSWSQQTVLVKDQIVNILSSVGHIWPLLQFLNSCCKAKQPQT